jgi:hypothetical protein
VTDSSYFADTIAVGSWNEVVLVQLGDGDQDEPTAVIQLSPDDARQVASSLLDAASAAAEHHAEAHAT